MGKRQHQKDKMYLTYTEWSEFYGGKKVESLENEHIKFKRLPFGNCCITMAPFEMPYSDLNGNVFEYEAILKFLKKFKVNPITGQKMDSKSLIKLHFHKNANDEYHCPALFKPFSKNSHIVAVGTTGNVYCWEAIEQLNIKTKNWKDLIDDTPFLRKDIITIQDPQHLEKYDISKFYYIRKNLRILTEEEELERKDPSGRIKTMNLETKETLAQLQKDYQPAEEAPSSSRQTADKFNAAHYSTGAVAASFTSTAMVPVSQSEAAIIDDDLVKYERVNKKGYVRLNTNFGPLNLELYCEQAPRACDNFIKHCADGYYNNVLFHRSIRNFIIQGGDPTGTGSGGKSIWGKPFEDEFKPNLSHTGRGVLSMANAGPATNGSQFFITYRSCKQLDGKHTIFGKLVGGLETLQKMENIEVDNKDRPIEDIIIENTQVYVNPFEEAAEQLATERANEAISKEVAAKKLEQHKRLNEPLKVYREGVGKYLKPSAPKRPDAQSLTAVIPAKKKKNASGFGDFSSW
ncbi:RING-type E3 ubiquitin-protein ligase PPIL2 [Drosophila sulfurigaster albostrigata]|uniref:RING-type E3 ubiquitin-protein ligase PPIL2 n=1 Tax=Drosophila sulfurigaster albostrigata TaxID=89887 RepID=UPI002D218DC9|nr:RING-type E3 ubiquitin-protein ligase PPIL2 [Drosophila sulfurigaster albostrigata]